MSNEPIHLALLDRVSIAEPCSARWDDMTGDDKRRFCSQCNLHVHNLSTMTRQEAEALLRETIDGRLCTRFFRRADGTILTQDCPVGVAAARARVQRAARRIAAAFALVGVSTLPAIGSSRLRALRPFSIIAEWLSPVAPAVAPPPAFTGELLGRRCISPPAPPAPPTAQGAQ